MTSHEEPEEGEQHGGNTVATAGKPYTRDVHHDTEPAPPRTSGYFAGLTQALTRTDAYRDGHLSRPAFLSLAILTFITFVGNFTQLQLSAALPTLVSDFHISVTLGQWMTSIFQLTMGVMVPLTAYLTRRFSTRQIVITSTMCITTQNQLPLGPRATSPDSLRRSRAPMHTVTGI